MKLLYSILITSMQVASNVNSVAASALRGEESRVEENATRRNLKKGMNLFDTDVTEYVHREITPESALQLKEAEDAYAGFEILFEGASPEGCEDTNTCLSGADPYATEPLRDFAAHEIYPWLKDNGGEGAQYLSSQDLLEILPFEGTDNVYEIVDEQLVAPSTSDDGGRRLASCPNYNANRCRSELRAVTRRSLTISYGAMTFTATGRMADLVMGRFRDSHWCTLEDWFSKLIATEGIVRLLSVVWWQARVAQMALFCVLALGTGFAAAGFNGFMGIVNDAHRWWEWVAFGAIWAASTAASMKTGGLSTLAAITVSLGISKAQISQDIVAYVNCINDS